MSFLLAALTSLVVVALILSLFKQLIFFVAQISLFKQLLLKLTLFISSKLESWFFSELVKRIHPDNTEAKFMSLLVLIISLLFSEDFDSFQKRESELISLMKQTLSVFKSMDLDIQLKPLSSKLMLILYDQIFSPHSYSAVCKVKRFSFMTHLLSTSITDSEFMSLVIRISTMVWYPNRDPEINSLVSKITSVINSIDLGSLPEEHVKLLSVFGHKFSLGYSSNLDLEWNLSSLITQLMSHDNADSEYTSLVIQVISLVSSADCDSKTKEKSEVISLIKKTVSVFKSMDMDSQPKPLSKLISFISKKTSSFNFIYSSSSELKSLVDETLNLEPKPELVSHIHQILSLFFSTEWRLRVLISQLSSLLPSVNQPAGSKLEFEMLMNAVHLLPVIKRLISLARSKNLDLQPKPQSKFMSLLTQTISVVNSVSKSDPEWEFISLVSRLITLIRSIDLDQGAPLQLLSLISDVYAHFYCMELTSELHSLIIQLFGYTDPVPEAEWDPSQLICLSPRFEVQFEQGKFHVIRKVEREDTEKCHPGRQSQVFFSEGEDTAAHFFCNYCNGEDHEECEKTLVEIKHPLHPKHTLHLVFLKWPADVLTNCFCCEGVLHYFFYYCSACDYAMNIACADKSPVLSIHHPKWHEHTLALFPRHVFLTCNLCALTDRSSPVYMCPSCDFVVHQSCLSLPRVIRISRHPHRISFTPSFDQGDWCCGFCRKNIDNDYGGYSCIKEGCSYAIHSRCATQRKMWNGKDLEGVLEDIDDEEVPEPFVRISDGVIRHFSHQQHHLRLDKNTNRVYDDNKRCQICITPIYFGNVYSCWRCDFILHEECANFSRKIHHPIHPYPLTLVEGNNGEKSQSSCSACSRPCGAAFVYECRYSGECHFCLHVKCATISEPFVHVSHTHPLFLTSVEGEQRKNCSLCKYDWVETFNCSECNFSLCFDCANIPQKVRYKHDKHTLFLTYEEETSTMEDWCEACEKKIKHGLGFYKCDEYCCVTLHINCVIGRDDYMKSGSYFNTGGMKILVEPNNHMSRPICVKCKERCPYQTYFFQHGLILCSLWCTRDAYVLGNTIG